MANGREASSLFLAESGEGNGWNSKDPGVT